MEGLPITEDSKLHVDLAQANLCRLRGDFAEAKQVCLGILKQFPNNFGAHQMMAEICEDLGDSAQALEWYQLCSDLKSDAPGVAAKIATLSEKVRQEQEAAKEKTLRLPPKPHPKKLVSIGMLVTSAIVVGVLAFVAGQKTDTKALKRLVVSDKVSAPLPPVDQDGGITSINEPVTTKPVVPSNDAPIVTERRLEPAAEDKTLTQLVAQRSPVGSHLVSIQNDPRSNALTLTFAVATGDPGRKIGADLARNAFEQSPTSQVVILRGVRNGSLAYLADVPRSRIEESNTPEWRSQHADPEYTLNYVLTNEWFKNKPTIDSISGTN